MQWINVINNNNNNCNDNRADKEQLSFLKSNNHEINNDHDVKNIG